MSSLVLAEGIRTLIGGPGMLAFVVPGLLWCALSYSAFTSSLLSLVVCLWTMAGVATGVLNFTPAHAGDVFSLRVGVTLLALGPLAVACASAARAEALRRLHHAVRHDDAEREFAYDRESHVGRLARALDEAPARGWQVISMRDDWSRVFP